MILVHRRFHYISEKISVHIKRPKACYVTTHAHCSIMLLKTINKIHILLLLKALFKPPSSVCNNFQLPYNVCFGHVMLLKYVICSESEQRSWKREHMQTALEAANAHQWKMKRNDDSV